MQAYLGALRRAALFRGMEDEQILTAVDCLGGQLRRYQKGAAVLRAGEPATHLGVVLTGQVQVSRARADGQRVVMGSMGPGGLFAESYACARAESLPVTVTTEAEAAVLLAEKLHTKIYVNQVETLWNLADAKALACLLDCPVLAGSLWRREYFPCW